MRWVSWWVMFISVFCLILTLNLTIPHLATEFNGMPLVARAGKMLLLFLPF